jgi:hypothetical protein
MPAWGERFNDIPDEGEAGGLRRGDFPKYVVNRHMCLGEKTLDAVAMDDELMVLARNKVLFLELDQMFGDPRSRCPNQLGEIAMSGVHRETDSFSIADAKVLAQLEQD